MHDRDRSDRRMMAVLYIMAALGIALLLFAATSESDAHEAPTGWQYASRCCSNRDCAEVPDTAVREGPGGYEITLFPGQHPMIKYGVFHATVPYASSMIEDSPDGLFHACILPSLKLICFYRGPRGM